jgi:hypothetical protein
MTGWVPRIWRQPSAVLLAVQLTGVLVYPFMDTSPVGRAALPSFALIVLFLAVRAVRASPALTWVAVLLGLPIVVLTIFEVTDPLNADVVLWSSILHSVFYFYTTFALLRYLFSDLVVTTDEIWAVGARSRSLPGRSPTPSWRSRSSGPTRSPQRSRPMRRERGFSCSSSRSPT